MLFINFTHYRRTQNYHRYEGETDYHNSSVPYEMLQTSANYSASDGAEDLFQMNTLRKSCNRRQMSAATIRPANTIEAKVEPGDTLQALALRFGCSVADIRRLNKIDKDNEIHAHKVLRIPMTVHNVLLDHLPSVHKSGNSSPREFSNGGWRTERSDSHEGHSRDSSSGSGLSSLMRNPLESAEAVLSEKLLVASVNSSQLKTTPARNGTGNESPTINDIILQAKNTHTTVYSDEGGK